MEQVLSTNSKLKHLMTSKIRSLGILLVLPLLTISAVTAFVDVPSANSLTTRDYSTTSDQHLTASFGNTAVCGDHLCGPGEFMKMRQSLTEAQISKGSTTSMAQHGQSMMPQAMSPSGQMPQSACIVPACRA